MGPQIEWVHSYVTGDTIYCVYIAPNEETVRELADHGKAGRKRPRDRGSGHALSDARWLDAHFEHSRVVYEAMARAVGLEPGWRVLDAGCGPAASCRHWPRSSAPPAR